MENLLTFAANSSAAFFFARISSILRGCAFGFAFAQPFFLTGISGPRLSGTSDGGGGGGSALSDGVGGRFVVSAGGGGGAMSEGGGGNSMVGGGGISMAVVLRSEQVRSKELL